MKRTSVDILVSGGGVAGLSAACAFGSAGFAVLCVDPAPPVTQESAPNADLRTTAFLQPSQHFLERIGLWPRLADYAAELSTMRIVDAGGEAHEARHISDFNSDDISNAPFGWNLPNWLLRREMLARIADLPNVTFRPGTSTVSVLSRLNETLVGLSDGAQIAARLLIAADGRNSKVRQNAGIGVKTWRYGQKALVFSVTHPTLHDNVSTEVHRTGGPFTMVPMPDLDGKPRSAVVWMDRGPRIGALAALDVADFEAAAFDRSAHLFGPLKLVGRRTVWPIISQVAARLTCQRTALIAEAAHVVPPIGAQGLNMSLADIASLLDLMTTGAHEPGSAQMLSTYERARFPKIQARVRGIDLLNRASMAENPTLRDLRQFGLKALHDIEFLRKTLMRAGLGAS